MIDVTALVFIVLLVFAFTGFVYSFGVYLENELNRKLYLLSQFEYYSSELLEWDSSVIDEQKRHESHMSYLMDIRDKLKFKVDAAEARLKKYGVKCEQK